MPDFTLTAASRRNVLELKRIDTLLGVTENRLATGRRVNTATDNPSSYFTASALSSRAAELNRVSDDISLKLQTLQAADAAITAITGLVQSAQSDLDAALASAEPQPTATGNIIVESLANVTDLAGVADSDQFSVQVGSASATTITITDSDTPTTLLNKLNAIADVSASYTTEGYLQISTTNGEDLTLAEVTNTPLAGLGIAEATYDQTSATNAFRASQAAAFDELRTQINELAADAGFNGVNLLAGDSLTITFNETGSSTLTIDGVTYDSAGLGISAAVNNFQLDSNINAAKAELENALDTLDSFSSSLSTDLAVSQIRSEFNDNLTNTLQAGADGLTLADLNEEGAKLLALQTRKNLASAAFSILQESESSVLKLF
jgi:flagellin